MAMMTSSSSSSLYPCILLQPPCSFTKPVCRFLMVKSSVTKSTKLQIRSSFQDKDKVFEDLSKGIICYRDDQTGEMICEGYDEGPRFHHQTPKTTTAYQQRDAEIMSLLEKNWARIAKKGDEFDKSISVQEDLNWN